MVQNNDTMLKVSRLLATGLEILVANAKFSVALATSWSQFWTLVLQKKENRVRRDSSLQRYMESFSAEDAVICILCGVRSACGREIGEKGSLKGKEIREDGVEEAEGIENRAVVDGVERREGFGLPVDDKLRSLDVSRFLSIFSSKANRRASIKSAFCVLVVAFVRFNEPLAIFMRSLMPRSLLS